MAKPVKTLLSLAVLTAMAAASPAWAVPGLSTTESVKKIVDMVKVQGTTRISIYDIEKKLRSRPAEAARAVVDILDTNDVTVKQRAAQLLSRLASNQDFYITDESLDTVIGILKASSEPKVKQYLLSSLGYIGPKNDKVKATILEFIDSQAEIPTKKSAIQALANLSRQEKPQLHKQSTEVLVRVLGSDDAPALRQAAADALSSYHSNPEQAVPALSAALDDNYLRVRSSAVQALGNYSVHAVAAIPKLLDMLKNETNNTIRSRCVYSLRRIGKNDPRVAEVFVSLIDDPGIGRSIMSYLYTFGGALSAVSVPKLIKFLDDPDQYMRQYACRALGALGEKAKDALPALTKLSSSSSNSQVRRLATQAIQKIQGTPVVSGIR